MDRDRIGISKQELVSMLEVCFSGGRSVVLTSIYVHAAFHLERLDNLRKGCKIVSRKMN